MKRVSLILVVLMALVVSACGSSGNKSESTTTPAPKKLSIVVTTTQISNWVDVLTGGSQDVYTILKPGDDPHNYKLSSDDINAIATADVIIKNGVGLEPWFDSSINTTDHNGEVIDASKGVAPRQSADPSAGAGDPHIWMSVVNAKLVVANIKQALTSHDPGGKDGYDSSERAYDSQLDAFINQATQATKALTNRFVVTDHEAYDYFCDEFNLQCVAAVTPVSGSATPPSSAQITAVANQLKGQSVTAVFATANGTPASAEELATDIGAKIYEGDTGLYGDSLGAKGGDADTYLKMMTHDLNAVVAALH